MSGARSGAPSAEGGGPDPLPLSFERIAERMRDVLRGVHGVDAVVAIARGGTVPGALAAFHLGVPLRLVRSRFRDDENAPLASEPALFGEIPDVAGLRVLLVDDVSVTGATLRATRSALGAREVVTLVVKGPAGAADLVAFPDVPQCVVWPWNADVDERSGAP